MKAIQQEKSIVITMSHSIKSLVRRNTVLRALIQLLGLEFAFCGYETCRCILVRKEESTGLRFTSAGFNRMACHEYPVYNLVFKTPAGEAKLRVSYFFWALSREEDAYPLLYRRSFIDPANVQAKIMSHHPI